MPRNYLGPNSVNRILITISLSLGLFLVSSCSKMENRYQATALRCEVSVEEARKPGHWIRFTLPASGKKLLSPDFEVLELSEHKDFHHISPNGCLFLIPGSKAQVTVEIEDNLYGARLDFTGQSKFSFNTVALAPVENKEIWETCEITASPSGSFLKLKESLPPSNGDLSYWKLVPNKGAKLIPAEVINNCIGLPSQEQGIIFVTNGKDFFSSRNIDENTLTHLASEYSTETEFCTSPSNRFLMQEFAPSIGLCHKERPLSFLEYCQLPLNDLWAERWFSLQNTIEAIRFSSGDTDEKDCVRLNTLVESKTSLHLQGAIVDLNPLRGLIKLEKLIIKGLVRDVSPLENLINLEKLDLTGNKVRNISSLRKLINLRSLQLGGNQIEIIPLFDRPNSIVELKLGNTPLEQVKQLSQFTGLTFLSLDGVALSNLEFVQHLPKLQNLSLAETQLKNLEGLRSQSLKNLSLASNEFTHLGSLSAQTPNLSGLDLNKNGLLESIEGLQGLESLRYLQLENTLVEDLSPISTSAELFSLEASNSKIKAIPTLSLDLKVFACDYCSIVDLSSLKDLDLSSLSLLGNPVKFDEEHCPTNSNNAILNQFCRQESP